MDSLQEFLAGITVFIGNVILPLLFSLALLFFLYHTFRFFVVGANDKEVKENARNLALYGIGAFVFLVSIWGLVNLLVSGLGWGANDYLQPDYFNQNSYNAGTQYDYCNLHPGATDCK